MQARAWPRRFPTTAEQAAGLGSNLLNLLNLLNFRGLRHSTDDARCVLMIMPEYGVPNASPHPAAQRT